MEAFPFFMDVEDKTCLIVGGGKVAREKVDSLSRFSMRILIVALETDIEPQEGKIEIRKKSFEDEDLEEADFCICATSDRHLNRRISQLCKMNKIPVNVVDDAALCSFIMPSIVKRGPLTIAISTGGKSPAYAQRLRQRIDHEMPENIDDILERLGTLRKHIPELIPDQGSRKKYYKEALELMLSTENTVSDDELKALAEKYSR